MTFREEWAAQQEKQSQDMRALIVQARMSWIGRRVSYSLPAFGSHFVRVGEIVSVGDTGMVSVLVGYDPSGQPRYDLLDIRLFGSSVLFV
ncbi:MAG: hypothetical protein NVS2B12_14950 [Ktedonobacteraceae bacterium]